MKKQVKLNLGCGANKIPGYVNIDVEKSCKPDLIVDFINDRLPFKAGSVDEIVIFHTIEHIGKHFHSRIFNEAFRVLKSNGKLYVSYPEFWKCAQLWHKNWKGMRDFWEKTIYGRQLYPSDFHVCIMDPFELSITLQVCGFKNIQHTPELKEKYNTITVAERADHKYVTYEELLASDRVVIKKRR